MYFEITKNHSLGFVKGQFVKADNSFAESMKGHIKECTKKEYNSYVQGIEDAKQKKIDAENAKIIAERKAADKEEAELRKEAEAELKTEIAAAEKAKKEKEAAAKNEADKLAKEAKEAAKNEAESIAELKRKQRKEQIKQELRSKL